MEGVGDQGGYELAGMSEIFSPLQLAQVWNTKTMGELPPPPLSIRFRLLVTLLPPFPLLPQ